MKWTPGSLAHRTDLVFPQFDGEVLHRGEYIVVRTPANPDFYWGNYLLFDAPPGPADLDRWPELFRRELGGLPGIRHVALTWDGDEVGHARAFVDAGYHLTDHTVLTTRAPRAPRRPREDLEIRPLRGDEDWLAMMQLNARSDNAERVDPAYRRFKRALRTRYRTMVEASAGFWLGAFERGRLIGQLGVFFAPPLARFQNVETDPAHRRRGVCSTLFSRASEMALARPGIERLVVVAEPEGPAVRIYRSLGFQDAGRQLGLELAPGPESRHMAPGTQQRR